jgi:CheY-like chemotaxis protein
MIPQIGETKSIWCFRRGQNIISEASDELEAVQKAQDLKPEIILLDIGLPKLNGIEAARQIRPLSPSSKIIFLSQNRDLDVVSWRSSASGIANSAVPQSKQTTTSGNTHTTGLSIFFSPRKWMPISVLNFFWLTDPQDSQGIVLWLILEKFVFPRRKFSYLDVIDTGPFEQHGLNQHRTKFD